MKVLIAYYSETGNTEKIAKAIHEVASQNHESYLKKLNKVKVEDLLNSDLVFLGSACHDANLAKPILRILKKIPKSPNFTIAGFYTHSTVPPEKNKSLFEKWAGECSKTFEKLEKEKEINFKGCFRCQGVPTSPIEMFIHKTIITDEEEWVEYLEEVKKHPNKLDLENAKKFAQDILNQC